MKKNKNNPKQIGRSKKWSKEISPVRPEKNIPAKSDPNPDPTKPKPGGNEPQKNDPTRIEEPQKNDPTRIDEPSQPPPPLNQEFFLENSVNSTIDALNNLIQIQNHRLEGYRKVKELNNQNADIKNFLPEGGALSHACIVYLVKSVMLFGKEPAIEKKNSETFSHAWVHAKSALSCNSYKMILRAFETGEKETQRAYDYTLQIKSVPAYIREILILQKQKLQEQYDHIRCLHNIEIGEENLIENI